GRSFARFESRFQLFWCLGALVPVAFAPPLTAGFLVISVTATAAVTRYVIGARRAQEEHEHRLQTFAVEGASEAAPPRPKGFERVRSIGRRRRGEPEAQAHVPAEREAGEIEAPVGREGGAPEGGLEVGDQAGVVHVLAAAVGASEGEAEAAEAEPGRGPSRLDHVLTLRRSAEAVDEHHEAVAGARSERAAERDRAEPGVYERGRPGLGRRRRAGEEPVPEVRRDRPEVAGEGHGTGQHG
ncbi:MAG TPA: hypothetical protein PKW35_16355, partial [Nannocystaceae bacterium]|nr:hypothetical protein [Nannocystaceae bacterium]